MVTTTTTTPAKLAGVLARPLSIFVTLDNGSGNPLELQEYTYCVDTMDRLCEAEALILNMHVAPYWQDQVKEQFDRMAVTILRGDFDQNSFRSNNMHYDDENDMITIFMAAGTHGIQYDGETKESLMSETPENEDGLVSTMRNENSGVPAKLRTYAGGVAHHMSVKCHPVNGGGVTVSMESETMADATHKDGYYVGGLMEAITFPDNSSVKKYAYAIGRVWAVTGGLGYIGAWNDEGTIYVEASEWCADRAEALEAAKWRGELAIFDVAAGESIYL